MSHYSNEVTIDLLKGHLRSFRGSEKRIIYECAKDDFDLVFRAIKSHLIDLSSGIVDDYYRTESLGKFFGRLFPGKIPSFEAWLNVERSKPAEDIRILEKFQLGLEMGRDYGPCASASGELYELVFPKK